MSSLLESNAVDDSDEYDFDEFSAADLDAIPALSAPASTQVEQVEQPVQPQQQDTISPEHTNDLKDTTAPENTNTTATSSNTVVGHRGGLDETREPSPSSEYPDEFEYDNDFFAIVDNAESTVLCGKQSGIEVVYLFKVESLTEFLRSRMRCVWYTNSETDDPH